VPESGGIQTVSLVSPENMNKGSEITDKRCMCCNFLHCFLRQHYLDQVNGFNLSIGILANSTGNRSTPWISCMVVSDWAGVKGWSEVNALIPLYRSCCLVLTKPVFTDNLTTE
jgi:hypothetical protein